MIHTMFSVRASVNEEVYSRFDDCKSCGYQKYYMLALMKKKNDKIIRL